MPETPPQRIALVTGANRGIGLEVVRQLAQRGLHVILTSRNEAKGEAATKLLREDGLNIEYLQLDVSNESSVDHARAEVESRFGQLDVLVNNAAVYLDEGKHILDVGTDLVRSTLEINFFGPLNTSRAFIPLMKKHRYGRIVNVSSGSGAIDDFDFNTPSYSISKLALNGLTRILADEVKRHNIKVNGVCPGWVRTEMGGRFAPRSVKKGAETIVWLATLPDDGPTGGFFRDRREIDW